jgi:WD40 repeat protein
MSKRACAGFLVFVDLRSVITTPSPISDLDLHSTQANVLVTGHKDGRWRVWDIENQTCKLTSDPEADWVSAIRWVPGVTVADLRVLAVIFTGPISCWDINADVLRRRFTLNPLDAMETGTPEPADSANDWDNADWGNTEKKPADPAPEAPPLVQVPYTNLPFSSPNGIPYQTSLAVSPDGSLAAIGGQDGLNRLVDINEGSFLYSLRTKAIIRTVQFSPTRYWDCIGTDVGWVIIDLESKAAVHDMQVDMTPALNTPPVPCLCSAWSPDGQRFFVGYSDGMVRYWDVA